MIVKIGIAIFLFSSVATGAQRKAPLHNPALLNIGFVCRWQDRCMDRQERAMNRALRHVRKAEPPKWKIQLCNRNAGRRNARVDWIGFYNCIRNPKLRAPSKAQRRR